MKRLEEIKARADAATPGPWDTNGYTIFSTPLEEKGFYLGDICFVESVDNNDLEFIAHAREDIPYLLDMLDKLAEALDHYTKNPVYWGNEDEGPSQVAIKALAEYYSSNDEDDRDETD